MKPEEEHGAGNIVTRQEWHPNAKQGTGGLSAGGETWKQEDKEGAQSR
jgi:hypothetical protein